VALVVAAVGIALSIGRSPRYAYVYNAGQIVVLPHQRLLITDFGHLDRQGGHVLITDFQDKLLWEYKGELSNPHSAYPMPNGDILIADTGNNRVIEVNRASRIVWTTDDLGGGHGELGEGRISDGSRLIYPNDAKPLPNGQIMISCRLQSRVIDITKSGTIVRSIHGMLHRQHNPHVLANGDLLVSDSGAERVLEINKRDKIVWSYGGRGQNHLNWPRDAIPMPNGDILITDSDYNRLIEVTRSHQVVHYWTDLQRPYSAVLLPDGNILVGDGPGPGVVEINRSNQIVWHLNRNPTQYLDGSSATLRNPDFESTIRRSHTILSDWDRNDALAYSLTAGTRAHMVRSTVHEHGRYSAEIRYGGDSNGVYFSQTVRVTPGDTYAFSGWIRLKNVVACHPCSYGLGNQPGHSAEYELYLLPPQGREPPAPQLPVYSGTIGWTDETANITIPPGVELLEIDGYLRGQGTVWFDNVSLTKVP
jgi:hypothetical protein